MTAFPPTDERTGRPRTGFTLVELLIVIAIIALLASLTLTALASARERATINSTSALVQRLGSLMMERYETYRYRPLPINPGVVNNRRTFRRTMTSGRRELVRMELPDRITDLQDGVVTLGNIPAGWREMRRQLSYGQLRTNRLGQNVAWSETFQGAECLYAIVSSTQIGAGSGADLFQTRNIGDVDDDGRLEILDFWGTPIEYIRWAPGFNSPLQNKSEILAISIIGDASGGSFLIQKVAPTSTGENVLVTSNPIPFNAIGSPNPMYPSSPLITDSLGPLVTAAGADYAQAIGPPGGPWQVEFVKESGFTESLVGVVGDATNLTADPAIQIRPQVKVTSSRVDPLDPLDSFRLSKSPLFPLVVSAGPDERYGLFGLIDKENIETETLPAEVLDLRYATTRNLAPSSGSPSDTNAPYINLPYLPTTPDDPGDPDRKYLGQPPDLGTTTWMDNITNHLINQN